MDLRERVVAAVDAGMPQPQAAARFAVSLRTVERYLARRRATGSLAATEQRHGPEPTVRRQLHAWLPDRLDAAAGGLVGGPRARSPCWPEVGGVSSPPGGGGVRGGCFPGGPPARPPAPGP